jgi:hypothetical protein
MSNVVQLSPAAPPALSDHDLLMQTISLVVSLTRHTIEQAARIAALESRVPPPPFEIPSHWIMAKQAAGACGYSLPSIYRFFHSGRIVGISHGRNIYIDPGSLPKKGSTAAVRN